MTTFCSIIARNYLAHARVLARSIHAHETNAQVFVLVVDDEGESLDDEPEFRILRPKDIGLSRREYHEMATIYGVSELSTAVKPWLLRSLLRTTETAVIYLDPDVEIFSSIAEVANLAETHDIVLTPHTLAPMKRDGLSPTEPYILQAGVYNLGFIAVGQGSRPFLNWWAERLRRDCIVDVAAGYFVDQRWIDLVPGYFNHYILRSPCFNVAYWNADQRPLSWAGDRYEIDGEPLRFFHFSGFLPERPTELSKYVTSPRIHLGAYPLVAQLCRHYANRLVSMGYLQCLEVPYGLEYSAGGIRLDFAIRHICRKSIIAAERGESTPPPDPFEPDHHHAFVDWLKEPPDPQRPSISRYLEGLYEVRPDLRAAFPELSGPDAPRLLNWARAQSYVPSILLGEDSTAIAGPPTGTVIRSADGVNIVGYVFAESGVGKQLRVLVETMKEVGIPYSVVPFRKTANRQNAQFQDRGHGSPIFHTNIVCVNADELPRFVSEGGEPLLLGRHTIGLWAWEVNEFPKRFHASADYVDEVWVHSEHARKAVAGAISKPVYVFPLPIKNPEVIHKTRLDLSLPEGFLFLFCFDFLSVFERKNPLAVIEAFQKAFQPGEGPSLVIKSVNGHLKQSQFDVLRTRAALHPDIYITDGYLEEADQHAFMAACDAYVSLHRAEGYGLTMAEAMAMGKPVIGTGYSGNLEFMNSENSYLVPYTLVPIPDGCDPYPAGGQWAQPDTVAAARVMREIVVNPETARIKGSRAAHDIGAFHSPGARGRFLLERLDIGKNRLGTDRAKARGAV